MLLLSPDSTSINTSISTPIGISMELYFQHDEHVRKSLVIRNVCVFFWLPALVVVYGPQFIFTGPVPQFVFSSPDTQFVFACSSFYS